VTDKPPRHSPISKELIAKNWSQIRQIAECRSVSNPAIPDDFSSGEQVSARWRKSGEEDDERSQTD